MNSLKDGVVCLASLSIPMIGNAVLSQMITLVTMLYVGRIESADGAIYMGAATLGNMLCNITGYSLGYGMCCALDTLISQAYGAKLYPLMGLHVQRAILILTLFSIPVSIIWACTDTILRVVLFIDKETASLAGIWARYIVFGLWPTLMFQILRRFLQSCGIIWPTIIANIISTLSVIFGTYVMLYHWHWGFTGAAIGVVFSQWMRFLVLLSITWGLRVYFRLKKLNHTDFPSHVSTLTSLPQHEDIDDGLTDTDSLISSNSYIDNDQDEYSSPISAKEIEPMIELIDKNKIITHDEEEGYQNDEEDSLITAEKSHSSSVVILVPSTHCSKSPLQLVPELSEISSTKSSFLPSFPFDETWSPWSMEAFRKWPIFLSLALPAAVSLFLEWGSYEVMAGFAGQLGSIQLATHGVYMNTASLAYNGPLAIADATAVLTGNYLGNNQPKDASSMVVLGVSIDSILGLVSGGILLLFLRSSWGFLFTSDVEVIDAVYKYMPILFLYMFVDSVKCVTCNVLRSTGRPGITTYGNLFCCLFILIPTGWYLAIELKYGLIGLWGGMSLGWGVAALIYSFVLYQTDWTQQAKEAFERNQASLNKSHEERTHLSTQSMEH